MSRLTPPSSNAGTPVRNFDHVNRPQSSTAGPSKSSRLQDPDDSDLEMIKTDGSDAEMDQGVNDEGYSEDEIEAIEAARDQHESTAAPVQDQAAKDEPLATPSKRAGKTGQTTKAAKGKKKDADLFESDIVARWNKEFGDVCAPTKA